MSGFCAVPRMNGRSGDSAAAAVRAHELLGHERPQVVVGEHLDRVQLVRGAEAVEEVHERHPRRAASRPARSAPGRAPPAPTRRRAARSRSGAPPSRPSGRRRSTAPAPPASGRPRASPPSVSSPAILYMFGIISSRPCDAVNVVASAPLCSAPCSAPAAPPSLCISTTAGTVPHTLGCLPARPFVGQLGHRRGRRDRVDAADLVEPVGDRGGRLVAVDRRAHQLRLREHLDRVHRALLVARPAAGAAVVVEPVAVPDAQLDHRVLRAGAEAAVALEAVAARQAAARLVGRLLLATARRPPRRSPRRAPRLELGLLAARGVAEEPQVAACRTSPAGAWARSPASAPRSHASMWRAAFLPCPTPTVTVRSLGTMSPPANTPGQPVISDADTLHGAVALELDPRQRAQERGVGLLTERQDHGVRGQRLEAPGRLRVAGLVELHHLDLQLRALERGDRPQPVDPHALALGVLAPPPRAPASARGCGGRRSASPRRRAGAPRGRRPSRCCRRRRPRRGARSPAARRTRRCAGTTPRRRSARRRGPGCRRAWTGGRRPRRRPRRSRPPPARRRGPRRGGRR